MDTPVKYRASRLLILAAAVPFIMAAGGCEDNAMPRRENSLPAPGALVVNPSSITLASTNTYAVFSVTGGTPPYRWSLSDSSLGSIPDTTASSITYTRTASALGVNILSVVDYNRWSASATIYQE
jgi:hypothetical protein